MPMYRNLVFVITLLATFSIVRTIYIEETESKDVSREKRASGDSGGLLQKVVAAAGNTGNTGTLFSSLSSESTDTSMTPVEFNDCANGTRVFEYETEESTFPVHFSYRAPTVNDTIALLSVDVTAPLEPGQLLDVTPEGMSYTELWTATTSTDLKSTCFVNMTVTKKQCPEPTGVVAACPNDLKAGSMCSFSCKEVEKRLEPELTLSRTCQNDYTWDGVLPTCVDRTTSPCQLPDEALESGSTVPEYKMTIPCPTAKSNNGQHGPGTYTCEANGTWSLVASRTNCRDVEGDCEDIPDGGDPTTFLNGNVSCISGVCDLTCDANYYLHPNVPNVVCDTYGTWRPNAKFPTCQEKCSNPVPPVSGTFDCVIDSTATLKTCTLSCDDGYRNGPNTHEKTECDLEENSWQPRPQEFICVEETEPSFELTFSQTFDPPCLENVPPQLAPQTCLHGQCSFDVSGMFYDATTCTAHNLVFTSGQSPDLQNWSLDVEKDLSSLAPADSIPVFISPLSSAGYDCPDGCYLQDRSVCVETKFNGPYGDITGSCIEADYTGPGVCPDSLPDAESCPPGQYSCSGKTPCESCPPGSFSDAADSTECQPCTGGWSNVGYGNIDCTADYDARISVPGDAIADLTFAPSSTSAQSYLTLSSYVLFSDAKVELSISLLESFGVKLTNTEAMSLGSGGESMSVATGPADVWTWFSLTFDSSTVTVEYGDESLSLPWDESVQYIPSTVVIHYTTETSSASGTTPVHISDTEEFCLFSNFFAAASPRPSKESCPSSPGEYNAFFSNTSPPNSVNFETVTRSCPSQGKSFRCPIERIVVHTGEGQSTVSTQQIVDSIEGIVGSAILKVPDGLDTTDEYEAGNYSGWWTFQNAETCLMTVQIKSATSTEPCSPGWVVLDDQCKPCPSGTYNPEGARVCEECPNKMSSIGEANTECTYEFNPVFFEEANATGIWEADTYQWTLSARYKMSRDTELNIGVGIEGLKLVLTPDSFTFFSAGEELASVDIPYTISAISEGQTISGSFQLDVDHTDSTTASSIWLSHNADSVTVESVTVAQPQVGDDVSFSLTPQATVQDPANPGNVFAEFSDPFLGTTQDAAAFVGNDCFAPTLTSIEQNWFSKYSTSKITGFHSTERTCPDTIPEVQCERNITHILALGTTSITGRDLLDQYYPNLVGSSITVTTDAGSLDEAHGVGKGYVRFTFLDSSSGTSEICYSSITIKASTEPCSPGWVVLDDQCKPCPSGTYNPEGTRVCEECPDKMSSIGEANTECTYEFNPVFFAEAKASDIWEADIYQWTLFAKYDMSPDTELNITIGTEGTTLVLTPDRLTFSSAGEERATVDRPNTSSTGQTISEGQTFSGTFRLDVDHTDSTTASRITISLNDDSFTAESVAIAQPQEGDDVSFSLTPQDPANPGNVFAEFSDPFLGKTQDAAAFVGNNCVAPTLSSIEQNWFSKNSTSKITGFHATERTCPDTIPEVQCMRNITHILEQGTTNVSGRVLLDQHYPNLDNSSITVTTDAGSLDEAHGVGKGYVRFTFLDSVSGISKICYSSITIKAHSEDAPDSGTDGCCELSKEVRDLMECNKPANEGVHPDGTACSLTCLQATTAASPSETVTCSGKTWQPPPSNWCIPQGVCRPGYYSCSGVSPCKKCPSGTYSNTTEARECKYCEGGLSNVGEGNSRCHSDFDGVLMAPGHAEITFNLNESPDNATFFTWVYISGPDVHWTFTTEGVAVTMTHANVTMGGETTALADSTTWKLFNYAADTSTGKTYVRYGDVSLEGNSEASSSIPSNVILEFEAENSAGEGTGYIRFSNFHMAINPSSDIQESCVPYLEADNLFFSSASPDISGMFTAPGSCPSTTTTRQCPRGPVTVRIPPNDNTVSSSVVMEKVRAAIPDATNVEAPPPFFTNEDLHTEGVFSGPWIFDGSTKCNIDVSIEKSCGDVNNEAEIVAMFFSISDCDDSYCTGTCPGGLANVDIECVDGLWNAIDPCPNEQPVTRKKREVETQAPMTCSNLTSPATGTCNSTTGFCQITCEDGYILHPFKPSMWTCAETIEPPCHATTKTAHQYSYSTVVFDIPGICNGTDEDYKMTAQSSIPDEGIPCGTNQMCPTEVISAACHQDTPESSAYLALVLLLKIAPDSKGKFPSYYYEEMLKAALPSGRSSITALQHKCNPDSYLDLGKCIAKCPNEMVHRNGTCEYCQQGEYWDGGECLACPNDQTTITTGSAAFQCQSSVCPAGQISRNGKCKECPDYTYQPLSGETTCLLCVFGESTVHRTGQTECVPTEYIFYDKGPTLFNIPQLKDSATCTFSGLFKMMEANTKFSIQIDIFKIEFDMETGIANIYVSSGGTYTKVDGFTFDNDNVKIDEWTHVSLTLDLIEGKFRAFIGYNNDTFEATFDNTALPDTLTSELFAVNVSAGRIAVFGPYISEKVTGQSHPNRFETAGESGGAPFNISAFSEQSPPYNVCDNLSCVTCNATESVSVCDCPPERTGPLCTDDNVPGSWSEWVNGACSTTCGEGHRTKTRTCKLGDEIWYGCPGLRSTTEPCNERDCKECFSLTHAHWSSETNGDETIYQVSCPVSMAFPAAKLARYKCGPKTDFGWTPNNQLLPCTYISLPKELSITTVVDFITGLSCSPEVILPWAEALMVTALVACANSECTAIIFVSECGFNSATASTYAGSRRKRATATGYDLSFIIPVADTANLDIQSFYDTNTVTPALQTVVDQIAALELTAQTLQANPGTYLNVEINGVTYSVDPASVVSQASIACNSGYVVENGNCVECPAGTAYSSTSSLCVFCDIGMYQDQSAQSSCNACPSGQTTSGLGSTSSSECTGTIVSTDDDSDTSSTKKDEDDNTTTIVVAVVVPIVVIGIAIGVVVALKYYTASKAVGKKGAMNGRIRPDAISRTMTTTVIHIEEKRPPRMFEAEPVGDLHLTAPSPALPFYFKDVGHLPLPEAPADSVLYTDTTIDPNLPDVAHA